MAELTLHIPFSKEAPVTLTRTRFLPCTQYSLYTSLSEDPGEKQQILDHMESISGGQVSFEEDGTVDVRTD